MNNPESPVQEKPEWYSRYLPHRDKIGLLQFITFRLADSLPSNILNKFEDELKTVLKENHESERRKKIDKWLDSGKGCCALKHYGMAEIMQDTLLKFDGEKYCLIAWSIMPNHVHVLIEPFLEISKIVQSWKSFTGRWALKRNDKYGFGITGKEFWMREYWDRFIRDEEHLNYVIDYINNNPVKAGLCKINEDWKWSSAGYYN